MRLVIDIPEAIYNHTQEYEVGGFNQENDIKLFMAIKNGTPLPEHQGRIINKIEQARNKDKLCKYPYYRCIDIIKEEIKNEN